MDNQLSPDTIATLAMELTKQIANTDSHNVQADKSSEPKKFYLELYDECYDHLMKTYGDKK